MREEFPRLGRKIILELGLSERETEVTATDVRWTFYNMTA